MFTYFLLIEDAGEAAGAGLQALRVGPGEAQHFLQASPRLRPCKSPKSKGSFVLGLLAVEL